MNQIQDSINKNKNYNNKYNSIINNFNDLLNKIFVDKNGNLLIKELNEADLKKLPEICKDMVSINESPIQYFTEYKNIYINKYIKDEKEKEIIIPKITKFVNKLESYEKIKYNNLK